MCKTRMQTDELVQMLSSIARKKCKVRGNLRLEVLLESTQKLLDRQLKEKQLCRKRKWELKTDNSKKFRHDNEIDMENDCCEQLLEDQLSLLVMFMCANVEPMYMEETSIDFIIQLMV